MGVVGWTVFHPRKIYESPKKDWFGNKGCCRYNFLIWGHAVIGWTPNTVRHVLRQRQLKARIPYGGLAGCSYRLKNAKDCQQTTRS